MGQITIDYQNVKQTCEHCGVVFDVTRGAAYDDGEGASLYLSALHQCGTGRMAHSVIAIKKGYQGINETCAVCLRVSVEESEFRMAVVDPVESPWRDETYLGRIMNREEALEHPYLKQFFHIADHVVLANPTISHYFDDAQ